MANETTEIQEIDHLAIGNECGGRKAFQSRFLVSLSLPVDVLAKRIASLGGTSGSFLELVGIDGRDDTGYAGLLSKLMRQRLRGLLVTRDGTPVVIRVKDRFLQPLQNLAFNPEDRNEPSIVSLCAIEFFPFSHGTGVLAVTVGPPTRPRTKPGGWPVHTVVDLNYYLSRLTISKRPGRQFPLVYEKRDSRESYTQKNTYLHRILSVVADEIAQGSVEWQQIWDQPHAVSSRLVQKRTLVYTHACVIPSGESADDPWSLSSDEGVGMAECLLLNHSQYTERSLRKPRRYVKWTEGQDESCRIHGYTPMHCMGVILNGRSSFDATQYPKIFHGANFFAFLLAFSLRTVSDQLRSAIDVPHGWRDLYESNASSDITIEPIRARFFEQCAHFFGLDACRTSSPSTLAPVPAEKTPSPCVPAPAQVNYRLSIDRDRRVAILARRTDKSGSVYNRVLQVCDDKYYRVLRMLAHRSASHSAIVKHLTLSEVLWHYDNQTFGEDTGDAHTNLDEDGKRKAHSRINSLRRFLKRKGVAPDELIATYEGEGGGIVVQPAVRIDFPQRDALSGAVRDEAIDRGRIASEWQTDSNDGFYGDIDEHLGAPPDPA